MPNPLLHLVALAHLGVESVRTRWEERDRDGGFSSLEIAVIAVGLVAAAGILVVAITRGINARKCKIDNSCP